MEQAQRTINCGALRSSNEKDTVVLNGWIHRVRDHGGIYFIDLRDRYGKTQIVIGQDTPTHIQSLASGLHLEYCLSVTGTVHKRPNETINPSMPTGEIEVFVSQLEIISKSEVLPFMIEETSSLANEDLRLQYRYLDLRSGTMQKNIKLRHTVMQSTREYLNAQDFLEIETPTLIRSTPEGARDFLVPSRMKTGHFYALPQSPQLYKQILMMSGMDKYYQLARCYRDEDARGDRQPEHTQIDIELSFTKASDIYILIEGLMKKVFKDCRNIDIDTPFPHLTYKEAMNTYGSDKPDLRFALQIRDFSEFVPKIGFGVFEQALQQKNESLVHQSLAHQSFAHKGAVKVLVVPKAASTISRKNIEHLEQVAKTYGAKGLAWAKYTKQAESEQCSFSGGISKFLNNDLDEIVQTLSIQEDDLLLFGADIWNVACTSLGAVRNAVAKILDIIPEQHLEAHIYPNIFSFVWVTDFPLFDWDDASQSWTPAHHMFTMPQTQYIDTLESNSGEVIGNLYDLVCNGVELASGSIRIHNMDLQQRIFDIVGMQKEEANARFGFLLEALKYGTPPHGGIAPGLDRLLMVLTGASSIREVMSFPKNTLGASPMDGSPNTVSLTQLEELHLDIVHKTEVKK